MIKSYNGLRLEIDEDGVAVITMNKGDNLFTMEYVKVWHEVLDNIVSNPAVTGLITRGEGRAFSTGLDVKWLQKQSSTTLDNYHDELHSLYKRILSLGITTVAVVNGHAIAEGAFIALMHDYRIMREDKRWINWPEVHLKLPLTKTMIDLFRIKVSSSVATREALVFGKRLNALTAKSLGIVDIVTSEQNLMTQAKHVLMDALGKHRSSVSRDFLNDMKNDMYNSFVVEERLMGKL